MRCRDEMREKWRSDLESRIAQGSFGKARVSKVLCQVERVAASDFLGKLLRIFKDDGEITILRRLSLES